MNSNDRFILRELARKQLSIAHSSKNRERTELWKRHNALNGERPVIHIEIDTFQQEVIQPLLRCQEPQARRMEFELYHHFLNMELFDDDWVVPDYFPVYWATDFQLFGHVIARQEAADSHGVKLGHRFQYIVNDLHEDFEKLMQPSSLHVFAEESRAYQNLVEDTFGDILPTKMSMYALYAVPTQMVVHWMGMETMFCSMCDYPEEFHQMMDKIADDYIAYFKALQVGGYLCPTTGFESLGQGSLCFTDELKNVLPLQVSDVWGFMDSQETVGISPAMFREFIFPCYERIAREFGLLSYGCCEPVHPVWDMIETLHNLRKVSISPWCDEELMAERLRGSGIIYHRKPSPNFLGVGERLDEEAFRAHIEKTIKTARGCCLEITQRDVYTIHNDIRNVQRYIQIIRESIDRLW